jgi:hypothetical protein
VDNGVIPGIGAAASSSTARAAGLACLNTVLQCSMSDAISGMVTMAVLLPVIVRLRQDRHLTNVAVIFQIDLAKASPSRAESKLRSVQEVKAGVFSVRLGSCSPG